MLRKEHRIISFAVVMLCAIALSGCFGGGSGAGGGVAVGGFTTLFASVRSKAADNIEGPGQLSEAAHKVPNADGGVTQSANSGVSVVTTDSMTAAVTTDNGQLRYALTYTDSGGTVTVLDVEELNRGSGDGINFVELKDEDNNRTMYVDVYTDYEGDGDTDYLAAGLWAYVSSIDDTLLFGAFADGSDPFTQSNLEGLTGDATYGHL